MFADCMIVFGKYWQQRVDVKAIYLFIVYFVSSRPLSHPKTNGTKASLMGINLDGSCTNVK